MNSHRFAYRQAKAKSEPWTSRSDRRQFCARLSVFKMLSSFFCNVLALTPDIDQGQRSGGK